MRIAVSLIVLMCAIGVALSVAYLNYLFVIGIAIIAGLSVQ